MSAATVVDESSLPTTFGDLLRLVREDHVINSDGFLTPGFYAIAVHRFGAWVDVASLPGPLRRLLLRLHDVAYICVRNTFGIELPRTARVGRRVRFAHQHGMVIHPWATIGDETLVRHGVTIGARSNDPARYREQAPTIGRNVLLGVGCVVAGPVLVGDGARIGPNVVVLTDIPAMASVLPAVPEVRVRPKPRQPVSADEGSA